MKFKPTVAYVSLCTAAWAKPIFHNDPSAPPAASLINRGIEALGGEKALQNLTGVIYQSPSHYRSQSLMQSYNMLQTDRYIATVGHGNISFSFSDSSSLRQRIDRYYEMSEYWFWASPNLEPRDYSLVLQSGDDGYACFIKGNNRIETSAADIQGYVAAPLAEYYIHEALKLSPNLLTTVKHNNAVSFFASLGPDVQVPAVYDSVSNITILFDPSTNLPYVIRSYEDNDVFGPSTSDFELYNYTSVNGIMFPQRLLWVYNGAVLEDTRVSNVIVNPDFPDDYFSGLPAGTSEPPPAPPRKDPNYGRAELGEFSSNMLWNGEYTGTLGNLSATNPIADLPNFWYLTFMDAPIYQQWVIEFDDAVIVSDAPPHQNELVIQWVENTLKRKVTHLWLSHHHHDHSYGTLRYVQAGAKLIVPEVARSYWEHLPNVEIITYNDEEPYIHRDGKMQARFIWDSPAPHAEDWSYGIVTSNCPDANETVALFEADVWNPGFAEDGIDQALARTWLNQVVADKLPKNTLVTPTHGMTAPLTQLIDYLGYPYPNYTTEDWKRGGSFCFI